MYTKMYPDNKALEKRAKEINEELKPLVEQYNEYEHIRLLSKIKKLQNERKVIEKLFEYNDSVET